MSPPVKRGWCSRDGINATRSSPRRRSRASLSSLAANSGALSTDAALNTGADRHLGSTVLDGGDGARAHADAHAKVGGRTLLRYNDRGKAHGVSAYGATRNQAEVVVDEKMWYIREKALPSPTRSRHWRTWRESSRRRSH